jgi:N-acetylglutamate synthase-like GNAT family acetyltransferase
MIRKCTDSDFEGIYGVINEAAQAYKGVIPNDRWHEPYMPRIQLRKEIEDGVCFWGIEEGRALVGVMGIQDKGEVCLIRHAYVKTNCRNMGMGTRLLRHLESMTEKPILIGTWSDATWAIRFYQKNGYRLLREAEKNDLLTKYWNIPERQVETSVVLADRKWSADHPGAPDHRQSISR